MIRKEAWYTGHYRSLIAIEQFRPAPPLPEQTFDEWLLQQLRGYRAWARLPFIPSEDLATIKTNFKTVWQRLKDEQFEAERAKEESAPSLSPEEAEAEALRKKDRASKQRWREENPDYRKLRMENAHPDTVRDLLKKERIPKRRWEKKNPETVEESRRLWYEKHQKRMEEDPAYAEAYREKARARKRKPEVYEKILQRQRDRYRELKEQANPEVTSSVICKEAWFQSSADDPSGESPWTVGEVEEDAFQNLGYDPTLLGELTTYRFSVQRSIVELEQQEKLIRGVRDLPKNLIEIRDHANYLLGSLERVLISMGRRFSSKVGYTIEFFGALQALEDLSNVCARIIQDGVQERLGFRLAMEADELVKTSQVLYGKAQQAYREVEALGRSQPHDARPTP